MRGAHGPGQPGLGPPRVSWVTEGRGPWKIRHVHQLQSDRVIVPIVPLKILKDLKAIPALKRQILLTKAQCTSD